MIRSFSLNRPLRHAAFALALVAPVAGWAQPPTSPSPPPAGAPAGPPAPAPVSGTETPLAPAPPVSNDLKKEDARRHFQQAVALYEEGNFAAALVEFRAAYDLAPAPAVLFNIGLTEKALYRYSEASKTLERYLIEGGRSKDKLTPERRQQVVQLIEEIKSLLAPIRFVLTPRATRVTVDGRPMVVADDGALALAAGAHVVDLIADGYESQRREITIVAGVPATYEFALKRIKRTGRVSVTSMQAGTRISIDGKDLGVAPLTVDLLAGGHQLEARADGYETQRSELVLSAGQMRNVDIELQVPPPSSRPVYKTWWFWTGLGTAVAGGTAAAFLLRPGTKAPLAGLFDPGAVDVAER